ncbi:alpha/beta hydrolase family protein, partial [Ilumatobacter sp.]|uniref:alpha/beta hydrolase family protein n=1 Tax=Ilumatobacter sp. TaxID=1967498 RepID=UPI003C45540A
MSTDKIVAPYGTWPSPLSAADMARSAAHMSDVSVDGETVRWLQSDPRRGGRYAVMESVGGEIRETSPDGFNARTRVHEYGGGALGAGHGVVLACDWDDQRVHRLDDGRSTPVTVEPTSPAGIRWAAMTVLPGARAFVAVRESHGDDRPRPNTNVHGDAEAVNEIVMVSLEDGAETVLVTGPDFVSGPWIDPTGTRLAWLQWNHPDMPWDSAELWTASFGPGGVDDAIHVAGGSGSSVSGATWATDDRLVFSDDISGWWNVYAWTPDAGVERLQDDAVDSGSPHWVFSDHRLATIGDDVFVVSMFDGMSRIDRVESDADSEPLTLPGVSSVASLCATDDALVAIVGGPARSTAVAMIDLSSGGLTELSATDDDPAAFVRAIPESITFPTPDGAVAHAMFYPPTSSTHAGPTDELPPLVVLSHGGPTSAARSGLNAPAQYWASRGFAVVDVNYRGSVGYGRAYRESLNGNWGIHDVTDCIAATTALVERSAVDPDRLIIEGGSAGGYTTLLALCTTDVFAAGGSLFGVADLRALAAHTHKFESRYLDSMIGPWPEAEQLYVDRSPITHVDRLSTPMIVLQGDEDVVVPPEQAELIVAALRRRGMAHAYLLFEGEQHGFRKEENIARSLEARLAFYGLVLGFDPADDIELPEYIDA